jgi:hypothetical protein
VSLQEKRDKKRIKFLESFMEGLLNGSFDCNCIEEFDDEGDVTDSFTRYRQQEDCIKRIVEKKTTTSHAVVLVNIMSAINFAAAEHNNCGHELATMHKLANEVLSDLHGIEGDTVVEGLCIKCMRTGEKHEKHR